MGGPNVPWSLALKWRNSQLFTIEWEHPTPVYSLNFTTSKNEWFLQGLGVSILYRDYMPFMVGFSGGWVFPFYSAKAFLHTPSIIAPKTRHITAIHGIFFNTDCALKITIDHWSDPKCVSPKVWSVYTCALAEHWITMHLQHTVKPPWIESDSPNINKNLQKIIGSLVGSGWWMLVVNRHPNKNK